MIDKVRIYVVALPVGIVIAYMLSQSVSAWAHQQLLGYRPYVESEAFVAEKDLSNSRTAFAPEIYIKHVLTPNKLDIGCGCPACCSVAS